MKTNILVLALAMSLGTGVTMAEDKSPSGQSKTESSSARTPPPQAYEDCKGKKAGDSVQHTTREGKVAATCAESPNGLVARPIQPKAAQPSSRAP